MRSVALLLLLAIRSFAAIAAAGVFEVRPTNGSDSNGGGFVTGASGTDFSQQNSAQYTFTDLASTVGTTNPCVVSSASHNFVAADVGNVMQISAGTNWTTGFYQIVSVASNNATLDRACGSTASLSSGTYAVGGALKTIGKANGGMAAGNIMWVKAESTISISTLITINYPASSSSQMPAVNGYTSSRGDNGQVTIQASATLSNNPIIDFQTNGATFANFILDCNSQANTRGINLDGGNIRGFNLSVKNCPAVYGVQFNGTGTACELCFVTTQSGGQAFLFNNGSNDVCIFCVAYSNSVPGFVASIGGVTFIHSIAANNTGASSDGFQLNGSQNEAVLFGIISYKNGRDGVRFTQAQQYPMTFVNSIFYGNTGKDINMTTAQIPAGTQWFDYNAYESGSTTNVNAGTHDVTLTADPFVNGASNNFALNGTSGGGAALKAAGFPGTLSIGGTGSAAIGVLQPAGSGGQKGFPIVQ